MIKMNKINNYNKEEHIQFIETLIKTEQVAVFINNMDISERSKVEQNDTLEYLYNRIIELQNNWNELKKWLEEEIKEIDLYIGDLDIYNTWDYDTINDMSCKSNAYKEVLNKMQELEQGKDVL